MKSNKIYTQSSTKFWPGKETPQRLHIAIGVLVVAFFGCLLLHPVRMFLTEITAQGLLLAQIPSERAWTIEGPALLIRLLDRTDFWVIMTWQRSGLISTMIFSSLFVLLTFPLKGPLWSKIVWLGMGNIVGLAWSFIRLSLMVVAVHHLGVGAFRAVDFITGPAIDFVWIVPIWSLGLSFLTSAEYRKRAREGG